jgi:hypothetical protein
VIAAGPTRQVAEWPELPYDAWAPTMDTLHMKLQIIGKVRLALTRREPQWANTPLYLTARGLTTSPIWSGQAGFTVALDARPVAAFYQELIGRLHSLGIDPAITTMPTEVDNPIPFPEDTIHAAYDPEWAHRFWRLLTRVDLVLKEHRGRFVARSSLVSFWWGTFDLALARFSGRPVRPPEEWGIIRRVGGDAEQCCVGFWPGQATMREPAFFAYAYPKPEGLEDAALRPPAAAWTPALGEFILPYDAVRRSPDPRQAILDFAESTFTAGATRQRWDPALLTPYDSE